MHPLESLRQQIDAILRAQPDDDERRCGCVHLYGVAQAAAMLALRRGLDPTLATAAGMLHDIATYHTGDSRDHAPRSAAEARPMLAALGAFSEDEIAAVCQAIAHHSLKGEIHAPLDELLKDADVLQHYLYNVALPANPANRARLEGVLADLALPPRGRITDGLGKSAPSQPGAVS